MIKGHVQSRFDGVSMRYSFDDGDDPGRAYRRSSTRCSAHARSGTRDGRRSAPIRRSAGWSHFNEDTWELYNVEVDRAELHDLAGEHPEKLRELINLWFSEAGANGAFPLDDRSPIEIITTPRPQITSPREPLSLFPRRRRGPRGTGRQYPQPRLHHRSVGRHSGAGRKRGAVRTWLALRWPHAVRQGQPAALRLQLRRHARAENRRERGHAGRREPHSLRGVRQGRRWPAGRVARGSSRSSTARTRSARGGSRPSPRRSA